MNVREWLTRPPPSLDELHPNATRATLQALSVAVPRMLRSTVLTAVTFLVGSALFGVVVGAVLAIVLVGAIFVMDRRAGRAGFVAALVLVFVAVSAAVAVISRSLPLFFLPAAAVDIVMALVLLGTVLAGKPLFAAATPDFLTLPERLSANEQQVSGAVRMTLVGSGYFVARGLLRLAAFFWLPTPWFIAVSIAGEIICDVSLAFVGVRVNIIRLREVDLELARQPTTEARL
ncbi:hypothetical protein [Actinophytocola oryzae]|uniref:Intracellular septation protein A n=1 Tax=Actinophytocola oryzae TaxID=502181 RepID=A0A4R7W0T2_9PSEU|nr:hypothetical protein [Actinophytocola oryzae]TDV56130.1 hypothetical protein CLV71_102195 [Actinophytocola oryzae]